MTEHVRHPFEPVFNKDSRILILGTFPSVKSRLNSFYYGNPQNRFWKVTAGIFGEDVPETIEDKKEMLLRNNTAIWDVLESCDIEGSSDSSIRNPVANDIKSILENSKVRYIFANGKKAESLYKRYQEDKTGISIICLPSTSPANAAWSIEDLIKEWEKIREYLAT